MKSIDGLGFMVLQLSWWQMMSTDNTVKIIMIFISDVLMRECRFIVLLSENLKH